MSNSRDRRYPLILGLNDVNYPVNINGILDGYWEIRRELISRRADLGGFFASHMACDIMQPAYYCAAACAWRAVLPSCQLQELETYQT